MLSPHCERCEELIVRYREANRKLAELTKNFSAALRTGERDLVSPLCNQSREAHAECDALRQIILAHLQTHET
jgi:hypothetical protein